MRSRAIFALIFSLFACGTPASKEPTSAAAAAPEARDATAEPLDRWTKLGERSLSGDGRETIRSGADDGRYSSVRFVIKHGAVEITSVAVGLGDGTTWTTPARFDFGKGTLSRAIDLPGEPRVIRQVAFAFASRSKEGRSTQIEVWAR